MHTFQDTVGRKQVGETLHHTNNHILVVQGKPVFRVDAVMGGFSAVVRLTPWASFSLFAYKVASTEAVISSTYVRTT